MNDKIATIKRLIKKKEIEILKLQSEIIDLKIKIINRNQNLLQ